MSVLDRQPPLPETAPLRLLGQDEDPSQERLLVSVPTYEDEGSYSQMEDGLDWNRNPPNSYQEGQFNMDWNTLMFITGQNKQRKPNGQFGQCYNCAADDHFARDCPQPKRLRPFIPTSNLIPVLTRYCVDCGIKHLVQDCPIHPDKKDKATLNFIETIPLGAESEGYKSVKVVTRA